MTLAYTLGACKNPDKCDPWSPEACWDCMVEHSVTADDLKAMVLHDRMGKELAEKRRRAK